MVELVFTNKSLFMYVGEFFFLINSQCLDLQFIYFFISNMNAPHIIKISFIHLHISNLTGTDRVERGLINPECEWV